MAFFSSPVLLWARLACLSYMAFKMVTDPQPVLEYQGVLMLASSMNLPMLVYNAQSQVYGLIGVVLAGLILCDLGAMFDGNTRYFETAVFLRLCYFFSMCIYCYFGDYLPLCNSAVFAYSFFETWFGILTYSTLHEEKYRREKDMAKRMQRMQSRYDRDEMDEEERARFERVLEEAEYQKIMEELMSAKPEGKSTDNSTNKSTEKSASKPAASSS